MTIFGYARVSSNGQSLEAQLAELKAAGCSKIFQEKITGKHRERAALERVLKTLGEGDVLIITRLDRLARSSRDLLNIIKQITDAGASFKSLKDSWADTTTAHGRLILTVLAGLAEFERELIVERTGEGRERAMKQAPPAPGSNQAAQCRRADQSDRTELQRPPQHDLASGLKAGYSRSIAGGSFAGSFAGSQIGSGCPSWCNSITSADGLSASTCS